MITGAGRGNSGWWVALPEKCPSHQKKQQWDHRHAQRLPNVAPWEPFGLCHLSAKREQRMRFRTGRSNFVPKIWFLCGWVDDSYVRNEAVAAPRKGLDVPGVVGGVAQRTPQLCDSDVDGLVEVAKAFIRPYS